MRHASPGTGPSPVFMRSLHQVSFTLLEPEFEQIAGHDGGGRISGASTSCKWRTAPVVRPLPQDLPSREPHTVSVQRYILICGDAARRQVLERGLPPLEALEAATVARLESAPAATAPRKAAAKPLAAPAAAAIAAADSTQVSLQPWLLGHHI